MPATFAAPYTPSINDLPTPRPRRSGAVKRSCRFLQITSEFQPRRTAMEEVVREAQQAAFRLGDKREHRFVRIEEAAPCSAGNLRCQGNSALSAIESVVATPKRLPRLDVISLDWTYENGALHWDGLVSGHHS